MGILNGQPVSALITNPAFINKNQDDTMVNKLSFARALSGSSIADIQATANKLYAATGASESQTGTVYSAPASTITDGQSHQTALSELAFKFDPATSGVGHRHTGSAGDGPLLDYNSLAGVPLSQFIVQGSNVMGASGGSTDVTSLMGGLSPSSNSITPGVVVTAPYNRVFLQLVTYKDEVLDFFGNIVYGRITYSAGTWTLTYYSQVSGIETPYSFAIGTGLIWFFRELYVTLQSTPVYNPEFELWYKGVRSIIPGSAGTNLYGDVALVPGTNINFLVTGNTLTINASGGGGGGSGGINYIGNGDAVNGTAGWFIYDNTPAVRPVRGNLPSTAGTPFAGTGAFFFKVGHGLTNGTRIGFEVHSFSGVLPMGLFYGFDYYVVNASANQYSVSLSVGGPLIQFATAGTGTIFYYKKLLDDGIVSINVNMTDPLRGSQDFILSKLASNDQGAGLSYDFIIDPADQSQVLQVSFDYKTAPPFGFSSGSVGSESDLEFWIFDVMNQVLIPITPYKVTAESQSYVAFFQANANSSFYRFISHIATTNASAWNYEFVNVSVGPSSSAQMFPVTVAARYTTAAGQSIPDTAFTIVDYGTKSYDTNNAVMTGGSWKFVAPIAGKYNVKATFVFGTSATGGILQGHIFKNGSDFAALDFKTTIAFSNYGITGSSEIDLDVGDYIDIRAYQNSGVAVTLEPNDIYNHVSIELLNGGVTFGDSPNNVALRTRKNSGSQTTSGSFQDLASWDESNFDTQGSFNLSTGEYTVPTSGYYQTNFNVGFATNSTGIRALQILKNGTVEITPQQLSAVTSAPTIISGSGIIQCLAGDILKIQAYQSSGGSLAYASSLEDTTWSLVLIPPPVAAALPRAPTIQVFGAGSGTYVSPAGVRWIKATLVGGGGSTGGSNGVNFANSGGGGGGTVIWYPPSFVANTAYSYTVGAGGSAGGSNGTGNPGGATTLTMGTTPSAGGGSGGAGASSGTQAGGPGGASSGGNLNITGQGGGESVGSQLLAGFGGASSLGGGGSAGFGAGSPGGAYGGGASGSTTTSAPVNGANGADGVLMIEEFYQ